MLLHQIQDFITLHYIIFVYNDLFSLKVFALLRLPCSGFSQNRILNIIIFIQLTISFLIGWSIQWILKSATGMSSSCRLSNTKVMGNHVMYGCNAWFLRLIMSSLHALCCMLICKFLHVKKSIISSISGCDYFFFHSL